MPPAVPGLSRTDEAKPNPLALMAALMSRRPEQGMALLQQGMDLLRKAAEADPRLKGLVGAALRLLQQGSPDEDGGDGETHDDDEMHDEMPGPMAGSKFPVRQRE